MPSERGLYDPQWEHDACGDRRHCEYLRPPRSRHRGAWQAGAVEPHAPRGRRRRRIDRRRGGHSAANPARFFRLTANQLGFELPAPEQYGVAMLFLPQDTELRRRCEQILAESVSQEGFRVLGWRDVPTDNRCLGDLARAAEPAGAPGIHRRPAARGRRPGASSVRHPQADRTPCSGNARRPGRRILRALDVLPHGGVQGHVSRAAVVRLLSRPGRRGRSHGFGRRPSALQHEYFPELAAGATVPHDRPQWRDQHAARQCQPASGPREDDGLLRR